MNAEALIGKVLGTCTLQRLVGQGGMGAVFLAQQSRPRRQVAVKVLLPITPLNTKQLAAFLERFRRETDAAASLEHPNIVPVHEYGEQDGIAYLVMPYIGGGTLRDEMERSGPLTLQKTVDYLEQLAAALDFAHEHGVIHRDIKPANIMVTSEGRLLLADFGLVKIVAEGQTPQIRLTGAGAPVGTPDYMAPEQVIGDEVDTRADLYSLGVILFQMLTGTTPFQGETPMQIAAQHLQIPPPSPQMLRPDLPIAAEQVVLRAMAKRPSDRYMKAQEMAQAFRSALLRSGIHLDNGHTWAGLLNGSTASRLPIPKGQFDPMRQTASIPKISKGQINQANAQQNGGVQANGMQGQGASMNNRPQGGGLLSRSGMFVGANHNAPQAAAPVASGGLLSRTRKFPMEGNVIAPSVNAGASMPTQSAAQPDPMQGLLSQTGKFPMMGTDIGTGEFAPNTNQFATGQAENPSFTPYGATGVMTGNNQYPGTQSTALAPLARRNTGTLQPDGTMKLNEPVKVVKVPVGEKPGQYITGILPFEKQAQEEAPTLKPRKTMKPWMRIALSVFVVLVVLAPIGVYIHWRSTQNQGTAITSTATTNSTSSPQTQATAAAGANVILSDPLSQNSNGWSVTPANKYAFKNGAYHVTDHGDKGNGVVLPGQSYDNISYTLTMQEINGDDTSLKNTYGMIFRFSQQKKNGKLNTQFYSFEVVSGKGGEYQLWHYDDSQPDGKQWIQVKNGNLPIGKEFHQGKAANTIKITMQGSTFTVFVNNQQLNKTFTDGTLKSGTIGMIVNQDGTEIAFKNLLLTRN